MSDTVKSKKRWFLKAELAVLVCILCIWIIVLKTTDINSTKPTALKQTDIIWPNSAEVSDNTKENSTNLNELHSFLFPDEEQINHNTTKSKPVTFGLITGICRSIDKPLAVINNKIVVYEGDIIDGVTIVKIYKENVEFIENGKNYVKEIVRFP